MVLLTDIFHLPMLMWVILPLAAITVLVAVLLWDTRLPAEKKIFGKMKRVVTGKRHFRSHGAMS
jgi:hypothetical protein